MPYWLENAISKAQNVVSLLDLSAIWAGAFQKRNILGDNFLEVVLDFHFIGAALLKTDSLTVMITFSVTHFNLHCHCPLTLPPPPPIKWKPSRALTTTSKRWCTSALLTRKRYFQGPKIWFHIWIWAGTFQDKKSWGQFFGNGVGFPFYRSSPAKIWFVNSVDYLFVCSMFQYFTVSYSIYNIIAHWHLPFHSYKMKTQPHTHRF